MRSRRYPRGAGRIARGVWCAGLYALALACDSPTEPENARKGWTLQPGILLHQGIPAFLLVPDSIRRNVPFDVAFTTFAPGCTEEGGTEVRVTGMTVEAFPMDWTPTSAQPGPCDERIVRVLARSVRVQYSATGEGLVRIAGRREPGGSRVTLSARVVVY